MESSEIMNARDSPIKILLVEDNPGDFRIIQQMLKESEHTLFELIHVPKLEAGLKLLEDSKFDIVILDLNLPDSEGLDTFVQVLSKHPELPIIILTGLSDEEVGIDAVKKGAQDYLVKGEFNGKLLVRSIHYAIERKRLEGIFSYHINR